jgi:hypothetical protein
MSAKRRQITLKAVLVAVVFFCASFALWRYTFVESSVLSGVAFPASFASGGAGVGVLVGHWQRGSLTKGLVTGVVAGMYVWIFFLLVNAVLVGVFLR